MPQVRLPIAAAMVKRNAQRDQIGGWRCHAPIVLHQKRAADRIGQHRGEKDPGDRGRKVADIEERADQHDRGAEARQDADRPGTVKRLDLLGANPVDGADGLRGELQILGLESLHVRRQPLLTRRDDRRQDRDHSS